MLLLVLQYFYSGGFGTPPAIHFLPRLGARGAARIPDRARVTKRQGLSAPGATTYSGGAVCFCF
jgi:hypothetical protein